MPKYGKIAPYSSQVSRYPNEVILLFALWSIALHLSTNCPWEFLLLERARLARYGCSNSKLDGFD